MATRSYYERLLSNPNVQRGLAVIRATEGTARYRDPYAVTFGGRQFDYSKGHPGTRFGFKTKSGRKQVTTAHGAYQFLQGTWSRVAGPLGLEDMSPVNQDIAALALIDGRGGLPALLEGDMRTFVTKVGPEWASLPTAPKSYDQPTKGWQFVEQAWNDAPVQSPETQMAQAALPEPAVRPSSFDAGGLLNPAQAGTINPVTSANAGEMPGGMAPMQTPGYNPDPRNTMTALPDYGLLSPAPAAPAQSYDPSARNAMTGADAYSMPDPLAELSKMTQGALTPDATPEQVMAAYQHYGQSRMAAPATATTAPPAPDPMPVRSVQTRTVTPMQEPAMQAPQIAAQAPSPAIASQVAANPESLPPAQYAEMQALYDPAFGAPVPQTPVPTPAPVPAPMQPTPIAPQPVAPVYNGPSQNPSQFFPSAPPPATGNDVWNGLAMSGTANGGYELSRMANGNVTRYSPQYDRTDILNPDGSFRSSVQGRIGVDGPLTGGGIQTPQAPQNGNPLAGNFGVPQPTTRAGNFVRGGLGAAAGGVLGSALAGPAGGLLLSAIGRNLATGGGLLGNRVVAGRNGFPNAPRPVGGERRNMNGWDSQSDYDRARDISPAAANAIASGHAGLF